MIAYLSGSVISKNDSYLIILTNQSIGYQVYVTKNLLSEIALEQQISLFIHTNVKEDSITLYGFFDEHELRFFEQLISINGIGPKMATEILGNPLAMIKQAILNNDVTLLTRIKGLGKKTAERLVLELKNKIDLKDVALGANEQDLVPDRVENDVVEALMGLGYDKYMIVKTLSNLPRDFKDNSEEIVKWFLRQA